MAIDEVYEFVLGMNQNGVKMVNRWLFNQDGATGPIPAEQALYEAFEANVLPPYRGAVSTHLSFETARVRRLYPTEGGSFVFRIDEAGLLTDDPVPPNSVAVIAQYSGTFTRAGRSRFHVSGIPDSGHEDGVLDQDHFLLLELLGNVFEVALPAAAGNPAFTRVLQASAVAPKITLTRSRVRGWLFTLRSRGMEQP